MGYVLEGPDGAGKTTLAKQLARDHHLGYCHFGPPQQKPLDEYLGWLVHQDRTLGHRRVIDRFHLGESVYGPIFRGTEPLSVHELCTLEWALTVRGYTLVHVTKSLNHLVDSIQVRGDEMVQVNQLGKIIEGYWSIMQESFMPRLTYDWPDELPTWPEKWAERSNHYYREMDRSYPGTGSLEPQIILVGERLNPNLIKQSHGTVFGFGSASTWLVQAIWWLKWQHKVYLTNARKVNGDEKMVAREIRWLRSRAHHEGRTPPRVIALGQTATRVMADHSIPCMPVHHPSYHRRFHHREGPQSYAVVLAER